MSCSIITTSGTSPASTAVASAGGVVGAGEGDVLDLEAVRLAPLAHLLAEEGVPFLGEGDDAPDGDLIVLGRALRGGAGARGWRRRRGPLCP